MKKVLFFIEGLEYKGFHGGAEKVLCDLVNYMDKTRFDITLMTLWPCDYSKYIREGIKCGSVYPRRNRFYEQLYRLEAAANLAYRLHLKGDYDIECAYLEFGSTKIMSASTNKKAAKICWVHCDLRKGLENPERFVEKSKAIYSRFNAVACVSQTALDSFVGLLGCRDKARVVYNTIDDGLVKSRAAEELDRDMVKRKFTVVSVGRLVSPKNYNRMLHVCEKLQREGLNFDLWILGEGELREELETFIREHGLTECVKLWGFRSNPYPAIREADVLACSSNYEGFSTFITEGLILGKPIVTTECSGMRELLGDSEFGLITDNDDDAFCDGLRRMISSRELRDAYAQKAEERGKAFSTESLVRKTESFFLECCEKE